MGFAFLAKNESGMENKLSFLTQNRNQKLAIRSG